MVPEVPAGGRPLALSGADLGTASCGGLPVVGDPGSAVVTGGGTLSPAAPSKLFTVFVPPATTTLRVTLNVEPVASADLYLKLGSTASPGNFDCRSLLRLYPGDYPNAPLFSSIEFQAGQTRANNAILALPTDPGAGTSVRADSAGAVHFILDVNGYFR